MKLFELCFNELYCLDANLDKDTLLQEEINKLPKLAPAHVLVHLPTEHFINTGNVNT